MLVEPRADVFVGIEGVGLAGDMEVHGARPLGAHLVERGLADGVDLGCLCGSDVGQGQDALCFRRIAKCLGDCFVELVLRLLHGSFLVFER